MRASAVRQSPNSASSIVTWSPEWLWTSELTLFGHQDPLHLSLVFHLSHHTASRYTAIAEQLLGDELEQPPDRSHHLPSADEG